MRTRLFLMPKNILHNDRMSGLSRRPIGNVPQHAGWIGQIEHAKPPGLEFRRLHHGKLIPLFQPDVLDVLPLFVGVFHHKVHHEVSCVILDVEVLQKEPITL